MLLQKWALAAQQEAVYLAPQLTWQLSAQQGHRSGVVDPSHCLAFG